MNIEHILSDYNKFPNIIDDFDIQLFSQTDKDEIELNISQLIDEFITIIHYLLVMKILRIY